MADLFVTGRWFHYTLLPEHEKKIYMHIYTGLKDRNTDFTFPLEKVNGVYPPEDRIMDILGHVLWDNPAMYYVDGTNIRAYYQTNPAGKVRITYTEYYTPEQSARIEQILRMRVDEILDMLYDQAEGHPQIYNLYRYMIANIEYMYDVSRENTLSNLEARTIVGPLLTRLGVCAGVAKMFKLILDQLGIGCFYIRGDANGNKGWGKHGWNVVYLDGEFFHVDVTFDISYYKQTKRVQCKYFLRGDRFMWEDHRWDRSKFPPMKDYFE
jgi:hypothetical protein